MSALHLAPEILERFTRGAASEEENRETLRHLSSGCAECRSAIAGTVDLRETLIAATPDLDQEAIDRIVSRVRERETRLWLERADAAAHVQELLRHPPAQRATLVRNLPRFQTWGCCELLISESYSRRFSNAEEGVILGELAAVAAERLDAGLYGDQLVADMRGLAFAHLANAHRVASDLAGAEEAMNSAETLLEQGTGDPLHEARLFEMKALLRGAQRRFPEALRASKRAEARYALIGDRHKLGSVLLERALLLTRVGDHQRTEALLRRSIELLEPQRDQRLPLFAKNALAFYFNSVGRFQDAQHQLAGLHAAFTQLGDTLTALRMRWLEANAAAGLHQPLRAETLLCEVRSGFAAAEIPYDVALVSLDLAVLYLEQGRTEEVKTIAREIASVFVALQIQREAYAAALLFQQAVETETVTLALVQRFAQYLREAQSKPSLAFRQ
jgi:tetratricopeptide (TPR) repeat protein